MDYLARLHGLTLFSVPTPRPTPVAGKPESYAVDLGKFGQLRLVRESATEFALVRKYRPAANKHFTRTERVRLPSDTLLSAFRAADTVVDKRFRGPTGRTRQPGWGPRAHALTRHPVLRQVARAWGWPLGDRSHGAVPAAIGVVATAPSLREPGHLLEKAGHPPVPNTGAGGRHDQGWATATAFGGRWSRAAADDAVQRLEGRDCQLLVL